MAAASIQSSLALAPLVRLNIPAQLHELQRWVVWRAGELKPNGKFGKIPISPHSGLNCNGNDPANWLTCDQACAAVDSGVGSGIGIVLSTDPVATDEHGPLYLVAVDLDNCGNDIQAAKKIQRDLGDVYGEISPSMNGVRLFALSRQLIQGGNAGQGRELYSSGRFMTVTGYRGKGQIKDATAKLVAMANDWFPPKVPKPTQPSMFSGLLAGPPQTPDGIARVKAQLACISADCSYEFWRNIVWAIMSTNWLIAIQLALEWSKSAPGRFDQKAFDQLVSSFKPAGGITLGTLDFHARANGWLPVAPAAVLASSQVPETDATTSGTRLMTAGALKAIAPLPWRVRGLLPARGLAAIYGPSGTAKTFLALDLVGGISAGDPTWFGAKVKPAPVVYVALEGEAGIRQRLRAREMHHNKAALLTERFVLGEFTLLDTADAITLASDIRQSLGVGAVVVIDTLNQSAPGADENASADMGRVISNAKCLAAAIDGLVILVHHAGKDQARGMRGHSSLFAAMDAVIEVLNTPNGRAWRLAKSKDSVSGGSHGFELVPYVVEQDEDGEDVTSCAIRQTLIASAAKARKVSGKNQKVALQVLTGLMPAHPSGIPMKTALQAVGGALQCEPGRRLTRATEAIASLADSGHLDEDGGVLCIP